MTFEGTGKYFWLLFLMYLIITLTVKISLVSLFKKANIKGWKAFIPFYNKYLLIKTLDLKIKIFFMTFIPFANLYYYNIIISRMLEAFEQDKNDSVLFLIVPMYKFPELALKNPTFKLHLYDATEEFIHNEKSKTGIKEAIPFTIASKIIKYLGINLLKEAKDSYSENCKTLMK